MQKAEVIQALRKVLEAANAADAEGVNDLSPDCASERNGLYGCIKQALFLVGDREAQEYWVQTGEWPS